MAAAAKKRKTIADLASAPLQRARRKARAEAIRKMRPVVTELRAKGIGAGQRRREILFMKPEIKKLLASLAKEQRDYALMLKSRGINTRLNGLRFFWAKEVKKAVPLVEEMLKDDAPGIRIEALRTLARLAPRRAIKELERTKWADWRSVKSELEIAGFGNEAALYQRNLGDSRFMDSERRTVIREQRKTGNRTFLLGGKLRGKALVKKMFSREILVWLSALEAGIPAEPILKKNGRFRIYPANKPGSIFRVYAKVLNGASLANFLANPENRWKYGSEVKAQKKKILERMAEIGISHHDPKDHNFIVAMERRKPKVYIIDFDDAGFENMADLQAAKEKLGAVNSLPKKIRDFLSAA